jgi:hypothetical protein
MYQVPHSYASAPLNPWVSMWTRPRATIRQIVMTDSERHIHLLAIVSGFGQALSNAEERSLGNQMGVPAVLVFCLMFGAIGGLIGLYLASAMLRWTGSWLGGQATSEQVRAAYAWSSVPAIWLLSIWLPKILIFGRRVFMDAGFASETQRLVFLLFALIELVVGIWGTVVFLKSLGEVHGFSAWKALGATILAILIVVVPLALLLFMLFSA